jgi:acyl-CoA dehydrogenase
MLLHPLKSEYAYLDEDTQLLLKQTIAFFEEKGKEKLMHDDRHFIWYDDFLTFVKEKKIFARVMTPSGEGKEDRRWDTSRIAAFAEVLGFYGLCYWYTFQVSSLGLGPIWMTKNQAVRDRAAALLDEGHIFAFALSEKEHGADIYSSDMIVSKNKDGGYLANGSKYYIGNANKAAMVSVFGKEEESGEYIFFVADSRHVNYHLVKNVVNSQSYVAEFRLENYPIQEADIMHKGRDAWDAALNTININKYNLGWGSIGICTHGLYEAITHAANRNLYGKYVTDFPHIKQLFVTAYARLIAMKAFAARATNYMRTGNSEDRRYLLYNPLVKMKVTTEGEHAINDMWDVMAAKGFEKDMYFAMAARDIRALPKLEGTVHVNMALIIKFMPNFFFNPGEFPIIPDFNDRVNDNFLFNQGATKGLGRIQFHDYAPAYAAFEHIPNVKLFSEQISDFKESLMMGRPADGQEKDIDFLLKIGEMFSLVVYGQLILEYAKIHEMEEDLVDQIFEVFVGDMSAFALKLHNKNSTTEIQMNYCKKIMKKPIFNEARFMNIWENHVYALKGSYEMEWKGTKITV